MNEVGNESHKQLCILLEIQYMKNNNEEVENYNDSKLFPGNWYFDDRYALKCDILMEALSKNVKIIETEKYELLHSCFREK